MLARAHYERELIHRYETRKEIVKCQVRAEMETRRVSEAKDEVESKDTKDLGQCGSPKYSRRSTHMLIYTLQTTVQTYIFFGRHGLLRREDTGSGFHRFRGRILN